MTNDPELFWFGVVLTLVTICFTLSLVGAGTKTLATPPTATSDVNSIANAEIVALQQQCQRLRAELQHQKTQLNVDFQDNTFAQLQPLLTHYPSARKMAESKPDLPARNFNALFTPLENLLQTWHVESIGSAWEQVSFNPQLHQPDVEDMTTGEPVYVRFVGYTQGDRILSPAKVSRTLPGGAERKV
ncbi:molecular chaperone GrpE [Phormidium sp. FACHB-592]|uniref:Molecular chaperone GrpE n=1 Tax=Stenomitos frigidus AS-A4 TaxID=2933935 RepID=A0ABV0KTR7_9CYAN|nr:molecular chaperone GrpE [Phormidium sp. FACHB-592]MBD2075543.1 molecular chaperone GrpE [Phormidium sp. FACHB-592]